MAITASYSAATRRLTVLGDAFSNSIIFTRDVPGTIFVNGGAVAISGGPSTVANTDFIDAFGQELNDVITLNETNGVLPAAVLSGGDGSDTLTGGSNGDVLNGDSGVDVLIGQGGIDTLNGGLDGDTMAGGDGNDVMNGEAGNDRMIWNPGDDNDVMEGGTENDIAEINGSNSAEVFFIQPVGGRVRFDRTSPDPFVVDIGTTENLLLNANGGDDQINAAVGSLVGLILLTINGGAGNDTILGSNGPDLLLGGEGNDVIDGNQGLDTAFMGGGSDTFVWDPGDASDTVDGDADQDTLLFNGSNASENITIAPDTLAPAEVDFIRDVAAVTMNLDDLETITYNASGGLDNVTIFDMTGTELTQVNVNLGAALGGGDTFEDTVRVNGTAGADIITALFSGGAVTVDGLFTDTTITNSEADDLLVILGNSGDDDINVSAIPAGTISIELQGGLGADDFIGSGGDDRFIGGDGNDLALMGAGNDEFIWNPGDDLDTVEGQAGTDRLTMNGNSSPENIDISVLGGRTRFFRDLGAVTMDLNDLEHIVFNAGGGIDNIIVNDLTGGETNQLTLNLAGTIGGTTGDSAVDTIRLTGTAGIDTVTLAATPGIASVVGLFATAQANQLEPGDVLIIAAGGGADSVNASAAQAGVVSLELRGEAGNDNLIGSAGIDQVFGGDNNDSLTGGPGSDLLSGELGNDNLIWNNGDGSDVMEGGDGSDTTTVNGGTGAETFAIAANVTRVAFNRIDPAPFVLDIGTVESLVLFAGDGNDVVTTSGNIAALIALTVDGGAGNDTILAGNGADILIGNDGNDFIDGNQANDIVFLGAGADVFQWDPGDGSDIVEGQEDGDTMIFNGNGANEIFTFTPNGGRATLTRDVGVVTMDTNDLEQFIINAGAGIDNVFINNLTGTDVDGITVNLAGTIGGSTGDGFFDAVVASATDVVNVIEIVGAGSSLFIVGLPALVSINQSEATDQLVVNALGGNDFISATSLNGGVTSLTIDGGVGDDTILASQGADTIIAGDGNDTVDGNFGSDTAFLGIGNDAFIWDPGDASDVVEGQAGADILLMNGSNASENVTITPNGGRSLLLRDVASVTMDMDDIETISFTAFGGTDNITINNLAGTDVTKVIVNLAGFTGGPDGFADTVTVNATAIGDIIDVDILPTGVVQVIGLFAVVEIRNFENLDRLIINLGDGNDAFDASGIPLAITIFGGIGNDTIKGGNGPDIIFPGAGINTVFWTPGPDLLDASGGLTTVFI